MLVEAQQQLRCHMMPLFLPATDLFFIVFPALMKSQTPPSPWQSAWQGPGASPGSCSESIGSRCRRPWATGTMENKWRTCLDLCFTSLFGKFVERNDEQRLLRWHRGSFSVRRHRVWSGGFWKNVTRGCDSVQSGCFQKARRCMVKIKVWTCRRRLHLIWKPVPDLTQKNAAVSARFLQCSFWHFKFVQFFPFQCGAWHFVMRLHSAFLDISRSEASSQISWRFPDSLPHSC